ncbi:sensory neuron membrane protein 2-like [Portunus trituberculatus]|uniref:sensory neuron membrane protein 2-like n=1 Tax=Portunus trituberculatus TaxID=210409 RepID=UPI001E1CF7FC|nr:sensory neuron membrane protein 2-like [Portunus trituberculatus]
MESSGRDNYGFNAEEKHGAATREKLKAERKEKKRKCKEKWTCCQITLLVLSLLTVAVSVALLIAFPAMFNAILSAKMEVVEGSYSYQLWHNTPVPIFLRFYIYNLTNSKDFSAGAKAVLQEVGPYVYREYHKKKNISFHDNNTVTFYQQRWWTWDQEASGNLTQEDKVVILNTVPVAAAWTLYRNQPFILGLLNTFFNLVHEDLIVTTTVGKVLFDGFTDPLLTATHLGDDSSFPSFLPPGLSAYDKFAWFYKVSDVDR